MMEFQVRIVDEDDPKFSSTDPNYFFDSLCFVALSLAEHKLEIFQEGVEIFNVYINDMSIGGRLHPYHSWAIWGWVEINNKAVDVRVELYIPERQKMEEKEIVSYCMGCGKIRHKKEGARWEKDDRDIYLYSHGYCPKCCKKVMAQYKKELKDLEKQER